MRRLAGTPTLDRFRNVGQLVRVEATELVVGYKFDLRSNELSAEKFPNPTAGTEHRFIAYRLKSQTSKPVSMASNFSGVDDQTEEEE